MKRRDFLKRLAAVCAAPVALAITPTPSPAKELVGTASTKSAIKIKPEHIEVIKGLGKAADKAAKATRDFSEGFYGWAEHGYAVLDNRRILLGDMSQEAIDDIKDWSVDQVDDTTRKEILGQEVEDIKLHSVSMLDEDGAYTIPGCSLPTKPIIEGEPIVFRIPRNTESKIADIATTIKEPYAKYVNFPVETTEEIKCPNKQQ